MKEIDEKLDQWIYNTIIRAEIRELIVKEIEVTRLKAINFAYDKAYELGIEAGLDHKINTND